MSDLPPITEILRDRETVDPETLERLRSLGYLSGNAKTDPASLLDPGRDPKNLIDVDRLLESALTAYRRGELDQAESDLRDLLRVQPDMRIANAHLAALLVDLGREDEAIDLLSAARDGLDKPLGELERPMTVMPQDLGLTEVLERLPDLLEPSSVVLPLLNGVELEQSLSFSSGTGGGQEAKDGGQEGVVEEVML